MAILHYRLSIKFGSVSNLSLQSRSRLAHRLHRLVLAHLQLLAAGLGCDSAPRVDFHRVVVKDGVLLVRLAVISKWDHQFSCIVAI